MNALFDLFNVILDLYWLVVVAVVIMTWLIQFNVINHRNEFVGIVYRTLTALTEPVFQFVRRIIPPIGGLDLAPLVVLLAIFFFQTLVMKDIACALEVQACYR
jgi:YggT family protein